MFYNPGPNLYKSHGSATPTDSTRAQELSRVSTIQLDRSWNEVNGNAANDRISLRHKP